MKSLVIASFTIVAGIILYSLLLTVPIYFLWNWLAPKYLYFLPEVWINLPFWETMGLVFLFQFIGNLLFKSNKSQTKD